MCASPGQEHVSKEELLQILEAVTELKGVDSSSTSLSAKTMMRFDKRDKDEKITKDEFISQCVLPETTFADENRVLLGLKRTMTCVRLSYQSKSVSNITGNVDTTMRVKQSSSERRIWLLKSMARRVK